MSSERAQNRVALGLLLLLAAGLTFPSLGRGKLEVYDEGLYGMYAQNALHHGKWLHAVDAQGRFPTGEVKFSKPPLSIWVTAASLDSLGPTLFALRLPFALATIAIALIAFLWGRLLEPGAAGTWLGFSWGALWLLSHGAYHFGRTATIEPLLMLFVLLALYAHARALRAESANRYVFCVLSGLGIAGAFFTKQLVCAVAALPILAVELVRLRQDGHRRVLARSAIALGLPCVLAGAWAFALVRKVGQAAENVLWWHAVVRRVHGFDGLHHRNYLNRIAEQLDLDAQPFSWELGLIGLLLFVAQSARNKELRDDACLIGGAFLCSWLSFDAGSQAILPWYAVSLLPALALGTAFLFVRAGRIALASQTFTAIDPSAALGAAALVLCSSNALRAVLPSPLVIGLGAAGVAYWSARKLPLRRSHVLALLPAIGAVIVLGVARRDGYHLSEADPLAQLGALLSRKAVAPIAIDDDADLHAYARTTFFGTSARVAPSPWSSLIPAPAASARGHSAFISGWIAPRTLPLRRGVELAQAGGLSMFFGDLSQQPFASDAVEHMLERGGLRFEAEDFASEHLDTLVHDRRASGGALRRADHGIRARPDSFALAQATLTTLPAGKYRARFFLELGCRGFRREKLGLIRIGRARATSTDRPLACDRGKRPSKGLAPFDVHFSLPYPARPRLLLRYDQGRVGFDRVEVTRS